jgi:hypothetical protein
MLVRLSYDISIKEAIVGTAKRTRVPVTTRALLQRINRAFQGDDEILKKSRGMRAFLDVGEYYTVDVRRNSICRANVDPEKLGRELEVLAEWEYWAEEES